MPIFQMNRSTLAGTAKAGQAELLPAIAWPTPIEIIKVRCSQQQEQGSLLFRFGEHQQYGAYLVEQSTATSLPPLWAADESLFTLLLFHQPPQPVGTEIIHQVQQVQNWIDSTAPENPAGLVAVKSILLPLQGVHLIWQPARAAIFADEARMEAVVRALIEASFFEQELRRIEREIDLGWESTQADSSLAFEFAERHLPLKAGLENRFQAVLGLRIALARLAPQILVPHVYPPTIASQIGERLRERTRMPERLELTDEKLSAQERVYDHCSQRAGEYLVARKGHILEWVIIILLFLQTVLWIIDYLSAVSE